MNHYELCGIAMRIALTGFFTATAALSHAALPSTAAGAPDPTFNSGAPVVINAGDGATSPAAVMADHAGGMIIAGHRANKASGGDLTYVVRHRPDGSADPAFAQGGMLVFGDAQTDITVDSGMIASDGRIWLSGSMSSGPGLATIYAAWLARLNPDGTPDTSFGTGGQRAFDCAAGRDCYYYGIAEQADHRVVVLGASYDHDGGNAMSFIDRYLPDGSIDSGFGTGGRLSGGAFTSFRASKLTIDGSGRLILTGGRSAGSNAVGVLMRLDAQGQPDPGFGTGGEVVFDGLGTWFSMGRAAVQADGKIVGGGYSSSLQGGSVQYIGRVFRVNADGSRDAGFGTQGMVTLPAFGTSVGVQADGRIVFAGHVTDKANSYRSAIIRLTPAGNFDPAFGTDGVVYPYSGGGSLSREMLIGADDRIVMAGSARPPGSSLFNNYVLARLIGSETTTNVVEFYNTALNHYFITADPNEASAIDNGAAGPGWARTGIAWKSGGPARVCRFYGSPEVDPVTNARRGPNGHFYTISAEECALVKEDAGWKFESYDFSGWPKQADGTCAAGTVAVKRAYNNRFAVNDSNHRYTTSDVVYQQMVTSGWSGEGVVFCAPI